MIQRTSHIPSFYLKCHIRAKKENYRLLPYLYACVFNSVYNTYLQFFPVLTGKRLLLESPSSIVITLPLPYVVNLSLRVAIRSVENKAQLLEQTIPCQFSISLQGPRFVTLKNKHKFKLSPLCNFCHGPVARTANIHRNSES